MFDKKVKITRKKRENQMGKTDELEKCYFERSMFYSAYSGPQKIIAKNTIQNVIVMKYNEARKVGEKVERKKER